MDFNDSPEEAAFRLEVRTWLESVAPRKKTSNEAFGRELSMEQRMEAARKWQMTKLKGGYGAITWPKMAGGRGGTPMQEIIYRQEEGNFNIPAGFFNVSLGMVIPSVMAHGSNEIRAKHAMAALSGKELWCQLLSEPNAGSDLGMVRTKAERTTRDGVEGWLINGQKVWTTMAQFADYGLVLCRTNPEVSKFKGLTTFYIDMKDPGVDVRPIRQASGEAEFNEVFLNDVFVPDTQRVGEVDGGWKVTLTGIMSERMSIGGVMPKDLWKTVATFLKQNEFFGKPAIEDGRLREKWVDLYLNEKGLDLMLARGYTAISKGKQPGAELQVAKLIIAQTLQNFGYFAIDLEGSKGVLSSKEQGEAWEWVERLWYGAAGMRIAGGTDEIVKNNVGERVLGLPAEPAFDKDLAFKDIPK